MRSPDDVFKSLLDRPAKAAPRYEPKVTIRVTDDRTKSVSEFSIPVPIQGESPATWEAVRAALEPILVKLGYR